MEKLTISIVFQPCEKGIRFIASLKQLVQRLLNQRYPSCNSKAHISICKIEVSEQELQRIIGLLSERLRFEHAQHIYFDNFATFPSSGTFFIDPTAQSKAFLKNKMRKVAEEVQKVVSAKRIAEPHLTISRGLDPQNLVAMRSAEEFQQIDFDFFCQGITLRKFNPTIMQYEAFLEIPFGNEKASSFEGGQLSFGF
ncbi:2'-5' RNA ligase family protein [Sphingobacterium sp. LRF_L2]|uniref:2'-5' RNA ligase family protein n=1 Tax=Sphingobacterium sp. LRF_L2 TaxID=3369421 RepID=UPI003F5FBB07